MGKYSSDSDYEKRSSKRSHKSSRRRSSSSESETRSRHGRKRRSSKYHSTSPSRDNYSRSSGRSRSALRQYSHKSKSHRRSSRDRSRHRSRRSHSRDSRDYYHRSRSRSKDRNRSRRSRSRSYIKEYVSTKRSTSSSSSTSDSDSSSSRKRDVRRTAKIEKSEYSEVERIKIEDSDSSSMPVIDSKVLEDINSDSFAQKKFFSGSSKKVPNNIVIDLKKQTIKVPEVEPIEPDSIFHHNLFLNEEVRMEKWVKELHSYRQKALQQGFKTSRLH